MIDISTELLRGIDGYTEKICRFIQTSVFSDLKRRGVVIGVSGGIDSAVALALCNRAVGKDKIIGLLLPESESSESSLELGEKLCKSYDIYYEEIPVTRMLESFQIYSKKNKIIRKYFPFYDQKTQKICLCLPEDVLNNPSLSVPSLKLFENNTLISTEKLRAEDYLEIMSLQNVKQRTRMIIEYMYSEKNNFAVCGTTNKTEYLTGYFVKYGDGGVDIEPLSDCYKTQIYALGKILKIDPSIIERPSSPDTWSFFISDENFYWRMPFNILDKLLFAQEHNLPVNVIIKNTGLSEEQISRAFKHIQGMRNSAKFLSMQPPICSF